MLDYGFFLDLAIILLCTKLFGTVTRKMQLPAVVGALLAGFVIGPNLLNIVHETEFIDKMAELGVIFIMFMARITSYNVCYTKLLRPMTHGRR